MSHNPTNPINWPLAISIEACQTINREHRNMPNYIAAGAEGSLAMMEVRTAQYAMAVSELKDAMQKVLGLQERAMTLVLQSRPSPEVDELLKSAGL